MSTTQTTIVKSTASATKKRVRFADEEEELVQSLLAIKSVKVDVKELHMDSLEFDMKLQKMYSIYYNSNKNREKYNKENSNKRLITSNPAWKTYGNSYKFKKLIKMLEYFEDEKNYCEDLLVDLEKHKNSPI